MPSGPITENALLIALIESADIEDYIQSHFPDTHFIRFIFENDYRQIYNYLLERNYDFNSTSASGESLIHWVAAVGNSSWLDTLIQLSYFGRFNLFATTMTNNNLYHYAAHIQDPHFLQILFSLINEASLLTADNALKISPLALAIQYDNELFFEQCLLRFPKPILNYQDDFQQNVLHLIAKHHSIKCCKKLLEIRENFFPTLSIAFNTMTQTPIDIARNHEKNELFELMMGFRENNMSSLQWSCALGIVQNQLSSLNLRTAKSDNLYLDYRQSNSESVLNKYAYYPQFSDMLSNAVTLRTQQQRRNVLLANPIETDQSEEEYGLFKNSC